MSLGFDPYGAGYPREENCRRRFSVPHVNGDELAGVMPTADTLEKNSGLESINLVFSAHRLSLTSPRSWGVA